MGPDGERKRQLSPLFSRRRFAKPYRLHVGSGRVHLEGWINIDAQDLPGVDVVRDVTAGLGFRDVEVIYAEHFLEHLPVDAALDFLLDCRHCLGDDGLLRLSTPNLEWVWTTHYDPSADEATKVLHAQQLNRAFYGWEHRFLWNRPMLAMAMAATGFTDLVWCRYGESGHEVFRGIERHETYEDDDRLPHVLIVEAVKGEPQPELLASLRRQLDENFLSQLRG